MFEEENPDYKHYIQCAHLIKLPDKIDSNVQ